LTPCVPRFKVTIKVIATDTDRFATYDFLLTFHCNHEPGLYRTVSEINGDFSRKSQIFPQHVSSAPCWRSSPWHWVPALAVRRLVWWSYRAEKEVWRYLQPSGYNARTWQTDKQTDGRTDTGRQQRPRLRIASRGKNDAASLWDRVVSTEQPTDTGDK